MENLENENLISGIVSVENVDESAHANQEGNQNDEGSQIDNLFSTIDEKSTDCTEESVENIDGEAFGAGSKMEKVFEQMLTRMEQRLEQAHERALNNAIETLRKKPQLTESNRSVPNFLVDVRKDVWE